MRIAGYENGASGLQFQLKFLQNYLLRARFDLPLNGEQLLGDEGHCLVVQTINIVQAAPGATGGQTLRNKESYFEHHEIENQHLP